MISSDIQKQIADGDGTHTEIISSTLDLKELAKTVCAFLNTGGGTIFCKDKLIPAGEKSIQDLAKSIQSFILDSISPKPLFTVNVDSIENKKCFQ